MDKKRQDDIQMYSGSPFDIHAGGRLMTTPDN